MPFPLKQKLLASMFSSVRSTTAVCVQQLRALRPMENEMPELFVQSSQIGTCFPLSTPTLLRPLRSRRRAAARHEYNTVLPNEQERMKRFLKDFRRRAELRLPLLFSSPRFCLFHSLFRNRLTDPTTVRN